MKHNTRSGIGYLYGPLFFLAVYKLLASSIVDPISALEIIVSLYHSIIFLDLSIFGKIQWCFFPNTHHILLYSLRFTGPFITLVVLLVVVFITKHFHQTMLKIFTSPIQGMCLEQDIMMCVLGRTFLSPFFISVNWPWSITVMGVAPSTLSR